MASYAIVPSTHPSASSSTSKPDGDSKASLVATASSLGVHDALRYGPRSLDAELAPKHPLEARLNNWDATQREAKLTLQRNIYGIAMPLRQLMERDMVLSSSMPPLPGQARTSDIHMDILTGKDESLEIADAFLPDRDVAVGTNELEFHSAMEKRLKL